MANGKTWTDEEMSYLSANYSSAPIPEILNRLGRTICAVRIKAVDLGLHRKRPCEWPDADNDYVREHYPNIPTHQIATKLGRSVHSIQQQARRMGIKKRRRFMRFNVNSAAFDNLTAETAYVVGLVLSDGCITSENSFKICNTERILLVKSRAALGSDGNILSCQKPPYKTLHSLAITDLRLVLSLRGLGIGPRKSLVATLPPIPDSLFFHFLRGYFDGNGGAHFSRKRTFSAYFGSGSLRLLEQVAESITRLSTLPLRTPTKYKGQGCWQLTYKGVDGLRLGDRLYCDAVTMYLPRKRKLFDTFRDYLFSSE